MFVSYSSFRRGGSFLLIRIRKIRQSRSSRSGRVDASCWPSSWNGFSTANSRDLAAATLDTQNTDERRDTWSSR